MEGQGKVEAEAVEGLGDAMVSGDYGIVAVVHQN
jgi:hypothetical protein